MRPVVLALLLAACRTEILAEEFDQSCDAVEECRVVLEGDVCGACGSPAAIRDDERADWDATITARTRSCTFITLPECDDVDVTLSCTAGTCTVTPED